jgi:conserved oligomeric Golgi complex subunit 2
VRYTRPDNDHRTTDLLSLDLLRDSSWEVIPAAWVQLTAPPTSHKMAAFTPLSPTRPLESYPIRGRGFALPSSSSSSDDEGDNSLPFPEALPRSDFLAPSFDPAEYLSSLAHRHQTLEDLRGDLRERSSAIGSELLELVNANYTSFLTLGSELKGGEEKVEDVRVALLGFRRAIEEVKSRVATRGHEVAVLNKDLAGVRREVEAGRQILELGDRLESLEGRLALSKADGDSLSEDSDDEENDGQGTANGQRVGSSPAKLESMANDLLCLENLADSIGRQKPFVKKITERMAKCRATVLLDLGTALKAARKAGDDAGRARTVRLMVIYGLLNAQAEAVKALQGK